jgi:hypothetical protein
MIASFVLSVLNFVVIIMEKIIPLCNKIEPTAMLDTAHTNLYCSLYSTSQKFHLKIMEIPYPITEITCDRVANIRDVTFSNRLFCTLVSFNRSLLDLYIGSSRISVPTNVKVPLSQVYSCRAIARERHTIRFTLVQGDQLKTVSLWSRFDTGNRNSQDEASIPLTPQPSQSSQENSLHSVTYT